jgi:hypothetical protein
MKERTKWVLAVVLLLSGFCLIAWNLLHDPDGAFREERVPDEVVTLDQVPPPVQATIKRESAGGLVREVQKETKDGKVSYEVDIALRGRKIEIDVAEDGAVVKREIKRLKTTSS